MHNDDTRIVSLKADDLLSGPRGRELCLLAALEVDREVNGSPGGPSPLGELTFRTAAGNPNVAFFTLDDDPSPARPVAPTRDAFLRAIADVETAVSGPDPLADHVMSMLAEAVDPARYWQEPEPREAHIAAPEALDVLRPWAERLCALPAAQWWARPVMGEAQFEVTVPLSHADAADAADSEETRRASHRLMDEREATIEDEKTSRRERPADPTAAWSGAWWPVPLSSVHTTGSPPGDLEAIPLGATLTEDRTWYEPQDVTWQRLKVPPSARVLEITAETWTALCREYPMPVTASRRRDWFRCTGRNGAWVIPDWARVAEQWDGVHLSVANYLALAGRTLAIDETRSSLVAGWSPDLAVWFVDLERW